MRFFIWILLFFVSGTTFAVDDALRNVLQEIDEFKKTNTEQKNKIQLLQSTLNYLVTGEMQTQQRKTEIKKEKKNTDYQQNEKRDMQSYGFTYQNKRLSSKSVLEEKDFSRDSLRPRIKRSIMQNYEIIGSKSPTQPQQTVHEVGFTAVRHQGQAVHEGEVLIFDTVITNTGSGYNPTTGIFVAPSEGLYVFFFDIECAKENGDTLTELVRDGVRLGIRTYCHGGGNFNKSGVLGVLHLNVGDNIWVRKYECNNRRFGGNTIFSGFLA